MGAATVLGTSKWTRAGRLLPLTMIATAVWLLPQGVWGNPTPTATPGNGCIASSTAGSSDTPCEACVCALDSFCCNAVWDNWCASEALNPCAASCYCAQGTPSATPTKTRTPSRTPTETKAVTQTATLSATATPTSTEVSCSNDAECGSNNCVMSICVSPTPTLTATSTVTISRTTTATRTRTSTATITPTATETPTVYTTYFQIDSDPGDSVGGGEPHAFTEGDHSFSVSHNFGRVTVLFRGPETWQFSFAAVNGQELQPGFYGNATDFATHSPTKPGLNVSGDGSGCYATGQFTVLEAGYSGSNSVDHFAVDF